MKNKFFKREMGDYFVTAGMLNHMNIAHGGKIINNADSTMGIFANSYCHTRTLTGRIDKFIFHKKSHAGDHINFCVTLLKTTKHTMTIYAEINRISVDGTQKEMIGEAVFTYVAVDTNLLPVKTPIPQYKVENSEEAKYIQDKIEKFGLKKGF
ncbi:hotdog domain-containing protein [Lactobacillus amylovorus]|jgi:acyl-CoA hydrolase|uniref:acyl-CoA thioesterase n=1 Tax=Lactobacillus amylovorus TaxID=1604 RepID=UPI00313AFE11